jgi:hypothetical protein
MTNIFHVLRSTVEHVLVCLQPSSLQRQLHFLNIKVKYSALTESNSMELCPSCEATSCSATQEIDIILWNPELNGVLRKPATGSDPEPD